MTRIMNKEKFLKGKWNRIRKAHSKPTQDDFIISNGHIIGCWGKDENEKLIHLHLWELIT